MKKIIIALILVLLVVFVGAPYFTGKVAETETAKMIEVMNKSSTEYGLSEIISYERRMRSTTARYKYTPPILFSELTQISDGITYTCESKHGITSIDYNCTLDGESSYINFVNENLNGNDPLTMFGTVSMFGSITQTLSFDGIENLDIDGETINLPKALLLVETDFALSRYKINGNSDAFEVSGENNETVSIGKMTLEGDIAQIESSLFSGNAAMEVEHFNIQSPLAQTSIKSLSVSTKTSEHGELINSDVLLSIKEVVAPNIPFESVKDINFGLNAKNLDKQALIDYQTIVTEIQRDLLLSNEANAAPDLNPVHLAKLMPILERMLKQGLEVNTNVSVALNEKPNEVTLDLALLESLTLAQLPLFLTDPDNALAKLDVAFKTTLNKSVVDSHPLAALVIPQNPLVSATSNAYELDLKLSKIIELNGNVMSFAELQSLVLSATGQ